MAITVQEVLKQSGFTDEQIAAFDQRAVQGFTTILSTADQARAEATAAQEKAELAQRATQQTLENEINPALTNWANEKARLEAEAAFYRTQAEQAKAGGFMAAEAPGFKPPDRGNNGQFVPGQTGSPKYVTQEDLLTMGTRMFDAQNEYFRLYGKPMPDAMAGLLQEAAERRLPFNVHVSQKYGFDKKKLEIAAVETQKNRDVIVKETEDRMRKEFAERGGANPNLVGAGPSQFTQVRKAVEAGQRKNPVTLSQDERRAQTRETIQREIADNAAKTIQ